ncbi:COMM domain-containing protein 4-like [Schistocerca gregaria]|uniref:COMM domain-containing protein 4-like n=1 Tax=Schistocerca gregaria TaxID=7010 RepID=UPI00211EB2D6|nr:COMM domain-containing protein 4-like [Schistocerca gregaria]
MLPSEVRVIEEGLLDCMLSDQPDYKNFLSTAEREYSNIGPIVTCLHFILRNAVKHSVSEKELEQDLIHIGFPREHAEELSGAYATNKTKLCLKQSESSLRLNTLEAIDWRVDYILGSSSLQDLNSPSVQLQFHIKKNTGSSSETTDSSVLELSADKFRVLLSELKTARTLMEDM